MELNKLCRTCLSASKDMTSLYETCATSTPVCCAEMLSTFTPLICCKDDGLSTMICHNCIREVNRCHTFRLKCLESDRVLRKHVPKVIGVAATNITVTNQQTELRNQDSIKLEADMDEDCRIFEVVSVKNEFPVTTSSKKVKSETSSNDPLSITGAQLDINQALLNVNYDLDVDIKIEKDENINFQLNNAAANQQESDKPYSCVCTKSFKQKQHLITHMRTHRVEKPYPCTVCDSSFKAKQYLASHMRTHSGVKPYSCTVCDSSFVQQHNLTVHMRTHTGEKPYPCTVCGSSFKSGNHLTMRTHTGKKPYSCTVCIRAFKQRTHLKNHMRTHTGEKPYPCTECGMSLKTKQSLMYHMQRHTGLKPYPCTVCDCSFYRKHILSYHMRTHAGENG